MANGLIRKNPIGRFALWDMRTDAGEADSALGKEFWDQAAAGSNGNASGAGFNITVTGASGAANATANALGAGFNVTISGATATASGTANVTAAGAGFAINITGADGIGSSATNGNATGAGFNVTITGASATASGTANASANGAGFNVTVGGATGSANATANAIGAGFAVTITGATGTATGTAGSVDGTGAGGGFGITVTGANGNGIGGDAGSTATLGGVSPGDLFTRKVRHGHARKLKRLEKERKNKGLDNQENATSLKDIIDDAVNKSKGLRAAYDDVKAAKKELDAAELRLIGFLEAQEFEMLAAEEYEIVKIIAEML